MPLVNLIAPCQLDDDVRWWLAEEQRFVPTRVRPLLERVNEVQRRASLRCLDRNDVYFFCYMAGTLWSECARAGLGPHQVWLHTDGGCCPLDQQDRLTTVIQIRAGVLQVLRIPAHKQGPRIRFYGGLKSRGLGWLNPYQLRRDECRKRRHQKSAARRWHRS